MSDIRISRATMIRPGILVSLKTSCRGGVTYAREEIGDENKDGANVAEWKTTRVIESPEEHEAATKARGKARSVVAKVCVSTNFGLLCPTDKEEELDNAMREARRIVEDHNSKSVTTSLGVYVIKGRIAGTDEEAATAILSEARDLIEEMNRGVEKQDVDAIREAATRAKQMEPMLGDEQAKLLDGAVSSSRSAARLIKKREGDDPKMIALDIQRGGIEKARMAFLDFDDAPVVQEQDVEVARRIAVVEFDEAGSYGM